MIFKPSNLSPNLEEINIQDPNVFSAQVNTSGSKVVAYRLGILNNNDSDEIKVTDKISKINGKKISVLNKDILETEPIDLSDVAQNGKDYQWYIKMYDSDYSLKDADGNLQPRPIKPDTKVCSGYLTGSSTYVLWTYNNEELQYDRWVEFETVGPDQMMDILPPNTDNKKLPANGELYRERQQIYWVEKNLGWEKNFTKLEFEEKFKYNYKDGTKFKIYKVSDQHTLKSVYVDPNDEIQRSFTIVMFDSEESAQKAHDKGYTPAWHEKLPVGQTLPDGMTELPRKIVGYGEDTGEVRVQEAFTTIPTNGQGYLLFERVLRTYTDSRVGDDRYVWEERTSKVRQVVGGVPIEAASFCIKTSYWNDGNNATTKIYIDPIKNEKAFPAVVTESTIVEPPTTSVFTEDQKNIITAYRGSDAATDEDKKIIDSLLLEPNRMTLPKKAALSTYAQTYTKEEDKPKKEALIALSNRNMKLSPEQQVLIKRGAEIGAALSAGLENLYADGIVLSDGNKTILTDWKSKSEVSDDVKETIDIALNTPELFTVEDKFRLQNYVNNAPESQLSEANKTLLQPLFELTIAITDTQQTTMKNVVAETAGLKKEITSLMASIYADQLIILPSEKPVIDKIVASVASDPAKKEIMQVMLDNAQILPSATQTILEGIVADTTTSAEDKILFESIYKKGVMLTTQEQTELNDALERALESSTMTEIQKTLIKNMIAEHQAEQDKVVAAENAQEIIEIKYKTTMVVNKGDENTVTIVFDTDEKLATDVAYTAFIDRNNQLLNYCLASEYPLEGPNAPVVYGNTLVLCWDSYNENDEREQHELARFELSAQNYHGEYIDIPEGILIKEIKEGAYFELWAGDTLLELSSSNYIHTNCLFIQPNINIITDDDNPDEIVFDNGVRFQIIKTMSEAGQYVPNKPSDITFEHLDDSMWLCNYLRRVDNTNAEVCVIPKYEYNIFTDFMVSMPNGIFYARSKPILTLQYKNLGSNFDFVNIDNSSKPYRDITFNTVWNQAENVQVKYFHYYLYDSYDNLIGESEDTYSSEIQWSFRGLSAPGNKETYNVYKVTIEIVDEYGMIHSIKKQKFFISYMISHEIIDLLTEFDCDTNSVNIMANAPIYAQNTDVVVDGVSKKAVISADITADACIIPKGRAINYTTALAQGTPNIEIPDTFTFATRFRLTNDFLATETVGNKLGPILAVGHRTDKNIPDEYGTTHKTYRQYILRMGSVAGYYINEEGKLTRNDNQYKIVLRYNDIDENGQATGEKNVVNAFVTNDGERADSLNLKAMMDSMDGSQIFGQQNAINALQLAISPNDSPPAGSYKKYFVKVYDMREARREKKHYYDPDAGTGAIYLAAAPCNDGGILYPAGTYYFIDGSSEIYPYVISQFFFLDGLNDTDGWSYEDFEVDKSLQDEEDSTTIYYKDDTETTWNTQYAWVDSESQADQHNASVLKNVTFYFYLQVAENEEITCRLEAYKG